MTNADRTSRGLRPLATSADLQSFAQRRAEEMARAGRLWHAPNLGSQISDWNRLGENVGRGPYLYEIHRSFMASHSHRDNILLPHFSQVGVGVASDGGQLLYVAVIFREPEIIAPSPPPPPPTPAPTSRTGTPRPRPAPATNPAPPPAPAAAPAPVPAPEPAPVPPAPDPPPPPAPEPPPPPAEVQGEAVTMAKPLTEQRWFQEANEWDATLPAPLSVPGPLRPAVAGVVLGLVGVCGGVHHGLRRRLLRTPFVTAICGASYDDDLALPTG